MQREVEAKYRELTRLLGETGGALVAFSGGADSALLLRAAADALGERVLAVTIESEIHPSSEMQDAKQVAAQIGVRHRVVQARPLDVEAIAENPRDRCYHCKRLLFTQLLDVAREEGIPAVLDGSNVDDASDYRPGERALRELGVRSPLREAGFSKAEIREASRALGLPTHDKPAYACLATRIPYGKRLTPDRLSRIARAEEFLHGFGLRQVRVRDHGDTARIEVPTQDLDAVIRERARIIDRLHDLGYRYVALDLEGYRVGSMNAPVTLEPRGRTS